MAWRLLSAAVIPATTPPHEPGRFSISSDFTQFASAGHPAHITLAAG